MLPDDDDVADDVRQAMQAIVRWRRHELYSNDEQIARRFPPDVFEEAIGRLAQIHQG